MPLDWDFDEVDRVLALNIDEVGAGRGVAGLWTGVGGVHAHS